MARSKLSIMNMKKDLFEQAEVCRQSTEYSSAVALYKKALNEFTSTSDIPGILNCFLSLGDTLRAKGDFIAAKTYYEEGLNLAESLDDDFAVADSLAGLGLSYRALGD